MKLDACIDAIPGDLAQVAAVGDETAARVARQVTAALQNSIRLGILAAMSEAAVEISSQLPNGHVSVRLDGQYPSLVCTSARLGPAAAPEDDAPTARMSLRLPDSLKATVESAAARDSGFRGPGNRLRGFSKA